MKTAAEIDHPGSWLHEAFLARAADPGNDEGRHALGAFLTLRLADRFCPADEPAQPLALAYQVRATRDYLADLSPRNVEVTHLMQVVRMADAVQQGGSRAILWPPLLAYANWLEQELRLYEALDAVQTALRLNDGAASTDEIAALLQQGRICRRLSQFEEAKESYEAARVKAVAAHDTHSQLLGRIGQAIIMRQVGNLSGSATALQGVLGDAEARGDVDAQARAHHDLGAANNSMGRGGRAIAHLFRAFELYEREDDRLRALSDLGESLKREGYYDAARDAFEVVLGRARGDAVKAVAMIALLELSALRRDRVGFARWRTRIRSLREGLPALDRVDFELQLGVGQAVFGQIRSAERFLRNALALAEEHGLNEHVFRAEAALKSLQTEPAQAGSGQSTPSWAGDARDVTDVVERLHALRAS